MRTLPLLMMVAACATPGHKARTWTRVQTACSAATIDGVEDCTETTEMAWRQTYTRAGQRFFSNAAGFLVGGTLVGLALGGVAALGKSAVQAVEAVPELSTPVLGVLYTLGHLPIANLVSKLFEHDVETIETTHRSFLRDAPLSEPPLPEPSALLLPH